ncbi:CD9 antigen-like [Styela clava]
MGLSGCMSCLKYLLFAFNFIFWLAGIAILALAIYFRVDSTTQNILTSDEEKRQLFNGVCYVLMAAGGAIMVVGFCGCCGAAQESRMLLTLFAVALFLLLGSEIGAGVYTAFHRQQVSDAVNEGALELWKGSAATNATGIIVDEIERDLDCCGYNNAADYCDLDKISDGGFGDIIIKSLSTTLNCATKALTVLDYCPSLESITIGCRDRIKEVLEKNIDIVVAVAISIGVVELLGLIFSILLCQAIGQDYTSGKLA